MLATFQQIVNELYIVWVIAVWYIGSVLGSCATIALLRRGHRRAARSVLVNILVPFPTKPRYSHFSLFFW